MIAYKNKYGFTLVEIMVGIIIVSIILIGGFQALASVSVGKVRLIQQTDIQKESFYFTQKLFEMIKKGGIIDYEEYFNRKVIGDTEYLSGHFKKPSGFGNFGTGGIVGTTDYKSSFYYCRSGDGISEKMTGSGCYNNTLNTYSTNLDGKNQLYGQYSFQFIDYNSNHDSDLGDEDGNNNIIGDDDDEYLGDGPEVFTNDSNLTELYLISGNKRERTIFRWNVRLDENASITNSCSINSATNVITGSGCIGTIEYLKLEGKDWGLDHNSGSTSESTENDGVIDTWIINKEFTGGAEIVAGSNEENYWVPLFPKSINVTEFEIYAYPNKEIKYAWKNNEDNINISPYVILKIKLKPSWLSRKKIKGEGKELEFSMTISLTDIYSN